MSLIARRLVFYALLLIFIILAPLVVGYTSGYRWSPTQKRLVKIGALSVTSIPAGAAVFLNHQGGFVKTPALIANLTPSSYTVRLEKDGYQVWQKTLAVESEKTTFAHNVPLFKKATPLPALELGSSVSGFPEAELPQSALQSFNQLKVFYDAKLNKIVVIDNNRLRRVFETEAKDAAWRKAPTPLLFVYSAHEVWQYNPERNEPTLLTRLTDNIQTVLTLEDQEALLLILKDRVRAIELDLRDRQNSWDLAVFQEIQSAALDKDQKNLIIDAIQTGQKSRFNLELR